MAEREPLCPLCRDGEVNPSAPVGGLRGTKPVVLYFGSDADRDEFIAMIREAKPGLRAEKIK